MTLSSRVYQLITQVPVGRVTTYKLIGIKLHTKAYRAIGQALKRNPFAPRVPCHRVVSTDGSIGGFKGEKTGKEIEEKIALLKKEGVHVKDNKVVDFPSVVFSF